jgi:hypothetical protein
MTTRIRGTVRGIRWEDSPNNDALASALKEATKQRYFSADEEEWQIAGLVTPSRGMGLKCSVYLPIVTKAILNSESDGEPTETELPTLERISVYFVPEAGYMFFEQPTLNSRTITPGAAITQAASYLLLSVQSFDASVVDFPPIRTERTQDWFVNRLLELAKSRTESLSKITVHGLNGAEVPEAFQIYNPDPSSDAIARRFLPDAFEHTNTLSMTAESGDDLSHNPLARAAIAAGEPSSIQISKSALADESPEFITYKKKQTGKQEVKSESPDADDVLEALTNTLIQLALEPSS